MKADIFPVQNYKCPKCGAEYVVFKTSAPDTPRIERVCINCDESISVVNPFWRADECAAVSSGR